MTQALAHPPERRLPRPTAGRIAALICVTAVSALLTAVGWTLFIGQIAMVGSFKDALITIIVQAGLVVVGPLVLWAYLTLMPKGLLTAIIRRMTRSLFG